MASIPLSTHARTYLLTVAGKVPAPIWGMLPMLTKVGVVVPRGMNCWAEREQSLSVGSLLHHQRLPHLHDAHMLSSQNTLTQSHPDACVHTTLYTVCITSTCDEGTVWVRPGWMESPCMPAARSVGMHI